MAKPKRAREEPDKAEGGSRSGMRILRVCLTALIVAAVVLVGYWHCSYVRLVKLDTYTYVVNVDPDRSRGANSLGDIARDNSFYTMAADFYLEAIHRNPESPDAYGNLALVRFATGDYAEAWSQVHLCQERGGALPPDFLTALSGKMPEPR